MSDKQSIIAELLAVAGENIGTVDANDSADVEKYLSAIVLASDKLSDEEFKALSSTAQNWFNAVAQAMNNGNENLADVAFSAGGLELSDLPTKNAPVLDSDAEVSDDTGEAQKAPKSPVTPPPAHRASKKTKKKASSSKKNDGGKKRAAFSKRNPWGKDTKARSVINHVIASNGEAAHDMISLSTIADGGAADTSLKLSVTHALQAFDCMRQAGWLNLENESVQSFIKSIEAK